MRKPVTVIYYCYQVLCTVHNCMCCTSYNWQHSGFVKPASPQTYK